MQVQNTRVAAFRLMGAYRISRFIGLLAELGLPDRMAAEPQSADALAAASGTHAPSLRRLLRLLTAAEVLEEDEQGRFRLTPVGEELRSDRLGPFARFLGMPLHWETWTRADHSIRTGDRAFDFAHGMRQWDYFAKDPEAGAIFDAAMSATTSGLAKAVVRACDFSRFGVVADVGGGDGTLLTEILGACPGVRGVLFDLPTVIERARPRMAESGVMDRCKLVAGSFLESVPGGADAYLMKAILHDWEDVSAARIVSNVRQAANAGSVLLVVERVLPDRVGPHDIEALLADVLMMVDIGGLERTEAEFGRLFASGGYRLERIVRTDTPVSVLEAVAV